jgi:hypothetical protein
MKLFILIFIVVAGIGGFLMRRIHWNGAAIKEMEHSSIDQVRFGRAVNTFLLTCLVVLLAGCTSQSMTAELNSSNFLQFSTITQKSDRFFAPSNITDFNSCVDASVVPAPRPAKCSGRFTNGRKLEMQRFIISITAHATPYADTKAKELALMIAGKIGIDQNYPYMIKLAERENGGCASNPSIYSSGTLKGNFYSGQSIITDNPICSSLYILEVLLFKKYDDIKNGVVLSVGNTSSSTWFFDLYYNMFDRYSDISSGDPGRRAYFEHHPINPWKKYLPSREVFETLSMKYGVSQSIVIPVALDNRVGTSQNIEDQLMLHAK